MVGLLARMTIATSVIVIIAEGVEYWRSLAYPSQQWFVVPLIMFFTILAIIANLWFLMKRHKMSK